MVTLSVVGELAPRGIAKVLCNGKLFCEMYMDRHHNTLLRDPGGMDTALWELYRSMSPEPEAYGNFPEQTLQKVRHDLTTPSNHISPRRSAMAPSATNTTRTTIPSASADTSLKPLLMRVPSVTVMAPYPIAHITIKASILTIQG